MGLLRAWLEPLQIRAALGAIALHLAVASLALTYRWPSETRVRDSLPNLSVRLVETAPESGEESSKTQASTDELDASPVADPPLPPDPPPERALNAPPPPEIRPAPPNNENIKGDDESLEGVTLPSAPIAPPENQSTVGYYPYVETPPPLLERVVRTTFCARLSPSQRLNCPSIDLSDQALSVLAASTAQPDRFYDPIAAQAIADQRAQSAMRRKQRELGHRRGAEVGDRETLGIGHPSSDPPP